MKPTLREIALVFLRLGTTAFGGPAAHIAMMEEEFVRRRRWLKRDEFLDLMSAANLIPGPNSTEVAIHVGHRLRGWPGLLLAGICFIAPAFLTVWAVAWFYVDFGSLPKLHSAFFAMKPVVLAVIAQAIWSLSHSAIKNRWLGLLCAASFAFYLSGGNEIAILLLVAITNLILRMDWLNRWRSRSTGFKSILGAIVVGLYGASEVCAQGSQSEKVSIEAIFLFFAKVGSVLFGSGYALIAFIQSDLVDRYHWLTQQQLLDAVIVGQMTPGPVFTTATFIGYLLAGHRGAITATLGIFAPAFIFVAISAPFVIRLRCSRWTSPILDGLNVASLGLMAGASLLLAKGAVGSIEGIIVFILSFVLLVRFKFNSVWLILAAGILGITGIVY